MGKYQTAFSIAAAFLGLTAGSGESRADLTLTYTETNSGVTGVPFSLPQFNPSTGKLISATLVVDTTLSITGTVTNRDVVPGYIPIDIRENELLGEGVDPSRVASVSLLAGATSAFSGGLNEHETFGVYPFGPLTVVGTGVFQFSKLYSSAFEEAGSFAMASITTTSELATGTATLTYTYSTAAPAAVPEPSTLAMAALTVPLALGYWFRRRS